MSAQVKNVLVEALAYFEHYDSIRPDKSLTSRSPIRDRIEDALASLDERGSDADRIAARADAALADARVPLSGKERT